MSLGMYVKSEFESEKEKKLILYRKGFFVMLRKILFENNYEKRNEKSVRFVQVTFRALI